MKRVDLADRFINGYWHLSWHKKQTFSFLIVFYCVSARDTAVFLLYGAVEVSTKYAVISLSVKPIWTSVELKNQARSLKGCSH